MIKQDIINSVAQQTGHSELTVREVVDATINAIKTALQTDEEVILRGFGTFRIVERKAHMGRDFKNGGTMPIAARKAVKFEPGKELNRK